MVGYEYRRQLWTSCRKRGRRDGKESAHEGWWRLRLGFLYREATDNFSVEERPGLHFRMTSLQAAGKGKSGRMSIPDQGMGWAATAVSHFGS